MSAGRKSSAQSTTADTFDEHHQAPEIESSERRRGSKVANFLMTSIRSTPYKAVVTRVGGRSVSISLAVTLLAIAVIFNFLNPFHFESDMCSVPSEMATVYIEKYKNLTNYEALHLIGNRSVAFTESLNQQAHSMYR